jgi:hypothetical protein
MKCRRSPGQLLGNRTFLIYAIPVSARLRDRAKINLPQSFKQSLCRTCTRRSRWPYWRINDEYKTHSLHSIYYFVAKNRVSLSVLVLRVGYGRQARTGGKNDRLLREPVRLLPITNRVGRKVGTGEDLRPCTQWPRSKLPPLPR